MRSISAEARGATERSPNERWERLAAFTPLFIALYFALQLTIRLLLSANLEVDDAEMFGQTHWAWGYANSHPPLYHWLVRAAFELTHSWVAATALPKFALLAAAYIFSYLAARRAGDSRADAAIVVAMFFFIPVVAWKTEGKLTHSVLGFAATAATVHALVCARQRGAARDFLWLGCAVAAGILAKYNFLLVLAGAAIAVALLPEWRRVFYRRAAWLAPLVSFALITPHLLWLHQHRALAAERLYILRTGGGPFGLELPANSLFDGVVSLGLVLTISCLPLLLLSFTAGRPSTWLQSFCGVWFVAELCVLIVIMIAGKLFQIHERYLLVLLPPFAFWAGTKLRGKTFLLPLAVLAAGCITIARPLSVIMGESRLAWPYAEMGEELRPLATKPIAVLGDRPENAANIAMRLTTSSVFDPRAPASRVLLVADDEKSLAHLAENLYQYAPASQIQRLEFPLRWQQTRSAQLFAQVWQVAN